MLVLGPWAGLLADRVDKRKALIGTQAVMAVLATLMAILTLSGAIELWMVYVLALGQGMAMAVDLPVRQPFVGEMVPKPLLSNAVALNAALFNTARVIGPALGGVAIVTSGTGSCFVFNACSYVAVLVSLVRLDKDALYPSQAIAKARGQIREAARYVRDHPSLRANLLLTFLVVFVVNMSNVLMPVLADESFDGDAGVYSAMTVAVGIGAIIGALVAARQHAPSFKMLFVMATAFGVSMVLSGVSPTLVLVMPSLLLLGLSSVAFTATSMAMAQLDSAPAMRGRVLALRLLTVVGTAPVAGPAAGLFSEASSPRWAMAISGLVPIVAAGAFSTRASRHAARGDAGVAAVERAAEVVQRAPGCAAR
jgi:MFS family permease